MWLTFKVYFNIVTQYIKYFHTPSILVLCNQNPDSASYNLSHIQVSFRTNYQSPKKKKSQKTKDWWKNCNWCFVLFHILWWCTFPNQIEEVVALRIKNRYWSRRLEMIPIQVLEGGQFENRRLVSNPSQLSAGWNWFILESLTPQRIQENSRNISHTSWRSECI